MTSLQTGEWVRSIHFKYTYFHIPINAQSRKYRHFHIQGDSYWEFGLANAPIDFTVVVKEVKLMAQNKV